MTVLPSRNPLLLGLYYLSVVLMFGFFAYIVVSGDLYLDGGEGTEAYLAEVQNEASPTENSEPKPQARLAEEQSGLNSPLSRPEGVVQDGFSIVGVSGQLQLNRELPPQINALWEALYASGAVEAPGVDERQQVYSVYSDYSGSSVRLSLGFYTSMPEYAAQGLSSFEVDAGLFRVTDWGPSAGLLDLWAAYPQEADLRYEEDFSVVTIDQNWQPLSGYVYRRVKY